MTPRNLRIYSDPARRVTGPDAWKAVRVVDADTGEPLAVTAIRIEIDVNAKPGEQMRVHLTLYGASLDLAIPAECVRLAEAAPDG